MEGWAGQARAERAQNWRAKYATATGVTILLLHLSQIERQLSDSTLSNLLRAETRKLIQIMSAIVSDLKLRLHTN